MLPLYQYVTASVGLGLAAVIFYLVRRDRLSAGYTVGWFFVAMVLCVFGLFPSTNDWVGRQLNVHYPPILLVILACCFILLKLLLMDIDRSRQKKRIRRLTQRLALYEAEVDPEGKSAQEVVELWDYVSDRLEKNFRRTVFSAPNQAPGISAASPRPVGGFGRRVVGQ